jgi:hypothetical protein
MRGLPFNLSPRAGASAGAKHMCPEAAGQCGHATAQFAPARGPGSRPAAAPGVVRCYDLVSEYSSRILYSIGPLLALRGRGRDCRRIMMELHHPVSVES